MKLETLKTYADRMDRDLINKLKKAWNMGDGAGFS
jgi:hypothetical protein